MINDAPKIDINNFESKESTQILDKDGNLIQDIGQQILSLIHISLEKISTVRSWLSMACVNSCGSRCRLCVPKIRST